MSTPIDTLFVAGSGLMGHGISQVAATNHVAVTVTDISDAILGKARDSIQWSLEKFHAKGRISEAPDVVLSRMTFTTDLEAAADAKLVIEAIPEREDLKRDLFGKLDKICGPEVLFASNTSAIPISSLAAATTRPDRFLGLHFFSPVPLMRLVEVIRGVHTSDATVKAVLPFLEKIEKDPVIVKRDVAGFLMNRIGIAAMLEAVRLLESGVGTAEDIDKGMRLGFGWKMGPLETTDMTGLDVILDAAEAIYNDTGNPMYMSPMLLKRLVAAGCLGRKSGRGFYDYEKAAGA